MFRRIKNWWYALGFLWSNRRMVWRLITRYDELEELGSEMHECSDCGESAEDLCEIHEEELERIGGLDRY